MKTNKWTEKKWSNACYFDIHMQRYQPFYKFCARNWTSHAKHLYGWQTMKQFSSVNWISVMCKKIFKCMVDIQYRCEWMPALKPTYATFAYVFWSANRFKHRNEHSYLRETMAVTIWNRNQWNIAGVFSLYRYSLYCQLVMSTIFLMCFALAVCHPILPVYRCLNWIHKRFLRLKLKVIVFIHATLLRWL